MKELKFSSAQDYLNYDFDDNWCFFYAELQAYGKDHPSDPLTDYEGKLRRIIRDLFKIYDSLVIDTESETLFGFIGETKILIKKSPIEE